MRRNLGNKPYLYPMPVLIIGTYDENGNPNLMNAAWGGISNDDEISICLSAFHKTCKNLLHSKGFTVSVATADQVKGCDYVGIASGNVVEDKVAKAGFTTTRSQLVDAPIVNELPFVLECETIEYDPEYPRLIGRIVNVAVDESVMDGDRLDVARMKPICFDPVNNEYLVLEKSVAKAFSVGVEK